MYNEISPLMLELFPVVTWRIDLFKFVFTFTIP